MYMAAATGGCLETLINPGSVNNQTPCVLDVVTSEVQYCGFYAVLDKADHARKSAG